MRIDGLAYLGYLSTGWPKKLLLVIVYGFLFFDLMTRHYAKIGRQKVCIYVIYKK